MEKPQKRSRKQLKEIKAQDKKQVKKTINDNNQTKSIYDDQAQILIQKKHIEPQEFTEQELQERQRIMKILNKKIEQQVKQNRKKQKKNQNVQQVNNAQLEQNLEDVQKLFQGPPQEPYLESQQDKIKRLLNSIREKQSQKLLKTVKKDKLEEGIKKVVTFKQQLNVQYDEDKKWNVHIEGEKSGRFSPEEQQILLKSIIDYSLRQNLSLKEFQDCMIHTTSPHRHRKMWTIICSVLPRRSLDSCFKFIKRKFNPKNYQGKWSKEEQETLIDLYQVYGRKWKRIGEQIGRTPQNVRDKFKSMGEQGFEQRDGFWKFQQIVELLKNIEQLCQNKFLKEDIQVELQKAEEHNQIDINERKSRKRMVSTFIFHNIEVIIRYIKLKRLKKIDDQQIKWGQISQKIKTKSKEDCRLKWKSILNIVFNSMDRFTYNDDQKLIAQIQKQDAENEYEIDFNIDNKKTEQQNKIRWNSLKKFISGRINKPFKQILQEIKSKVKHKPKEDDEDFQQNKLFDFFKRAKANQAQ